MRSNYHRSVALALLSLSAGQAALAAVVPGRVIARVGDSLGAATLSSVGNPFVNGEGKAGFLVALSDNTRSIWYDTGSVFNSASALPDVLSGGEDTIGIGNGGAFIYSPSFNGQDAVYTQNGLLLAGGAAAPGLPGLFNSFNSRPGMLADGTAVWVAGWSTTPGGASAGRVLYRCADTTDVSTSTIVFRSGDVIGGLAAITAAGIGFVYDFSEGGAHHIHRLILATGSSSTDDVVYLDGAILAREGSPAIGGDNYATFNAVGVNDNGDYVFSSNTSGATATDEILVHNGAVLYREGQVVDGVTLGSLVDLANIDNHGWVAFVWDSSAGETLFAANPAEPGVAVALLSVGDQIDANGDGAGDYTLTDFNASSGTFSDGGFASNGYFFANVDLAPVGGGAAVESVIRVNILQGCLGDLDFDFDVDIGDLSVLLAHFGTVGGVGPVDGDMDGDGDVDLDDLSRLLSAFGTLCGDF